MSKLTIDGSTYDLTPDKEYSVQRTVIDAAGNPLDGTADSDPTSLDLLTVAKLIDRVVTSKLKIQSDEFDIRIDTITKDFESKLESQATSPTSVGPIKYGDIRDYFTSYDLNRYENGVPVICDVYLKTAIFERLDFLLKAREFRIPNPNAPETDGGGWDHTNNIFCSPIRFPAGHFEFHETHWLPAPISLIGEGHFDTFFKYYGERDFLDVVGQYYYKGAYFESTRGMLSNVKIAVGGRMDRMACIVARVGRLHNHTISHCHITTLTSNAEHRSRVIGAVRSNEREESLNAYSEHLTFSEKILGADTWQLESRTHGNHIEGGLTGIEVIGRNCMIYDNETDYCECPIFCTNLQNSRIYGNLLTGESNNKTVKQKVGIILGGFNNTTRNTIISYDIGLLHAGLKTNPWGEVYNDVNVARKEFNGILPFDLGEWKRGSRIMPDKNAYKKYADKTHVRK
jgi:hypothetical protein